MSTLPVEVLLQVAQYLKHDRRSLKNVRLVSKSLRTVATNLLFANIFLRPNGQSLERATQIASCYSLRYYVRNLELLRDIVHECEGMVNHMRECGRPHVYPPLYVQDSLIDERLQEYMDLIDAQKSFRAMEELEVLRELVRLLPQLRGISSRQRRPPDHCDEDDYLRCLSFPKIPRLKSKLQNVIDRTEVDRQLHVDADQGPATDGLHAHPGHDRQQTRAERSKYCPWDFSRATTAFSLSTVFELCGDITLSSLQIHSLDYHDIDMQMPLIPRSSEHQFPHLRKILVDLPDYADNRRFRFPFIRDKLEGLLVASSNVEDLYFRFRYAQFDRHPPTVMKCELCAQLVPRQDWPSLRQVHLSGIVSNEKDMTQFLLNRCPKLRRLGLGRLKLHDGPSAAPGSFVRLLWRLGRTLSLEQLELRGIINDNDWYWNIDPAKETHGSLLCRLKQYVLGTGTFPFPDPEATDFHDMYKHFLDACTHQALVNAGAWKAFPDLSWYECQSLRDNIKRVANCIGKNDRQLEKRNECDSYIRKLESSANPTYDLFQLSS